MSTQRFSRRTDFGNREDNTLSALLRKLEIELELQGFLLQVSRDKGIRLTPAAALMLLLPLYEVNLRSAPRRTWIRRTLQRRPLLLDKAEIRQSLTMLVQEVAKSPATADLVFEPVGPSQPSVQARSTLSVIKAFWKRFCNIPPFCGEKE